MTKSDIQKDIIIYNSDDGRISFNVNVFDETVWLNQEQIGQLFGKARNTISEHINQIFKDEELSQEVVCRYFRHTTKHGAIKNKEQSVEVKYYNLDMILSVGYRVRSKQAIQFRLWANDILKQYLMNGYAINENRIKLIEEKIDNLGKEFRAEIQQIQKNLLEIANKPINIYNNISIASNKLEEKIIELIDQLIENSKDDKLTEKLKDFESKILTSPKDQNTKNKIINFFNDLGDDDSDISKKLKAIDKSKMIISKLIELGTKLKNLL